MTNECVINKEMLPYILSRCVEACNTHDEWLFAQLWNPCEDLFAELYNELSDKDYQLGCKYNELMNEISQCYTAFSKCADLIERALLPLILNYYETLDKKSFCVGNYFYFQSQSGLYSMRHSVLGENYYSEIDPMKETWQMAKYVYRPELETFVFLGCGLAYLPYQLWKYSEESLDIYIIDKSSEMFDSAAKYGMLNYIDPGKLHLIVCEDNYELVEMFKKIDVDYDKSRFIVSEWMKNEVPDDLCMQLTDYIENQTCVNGYAKKYTINRIQNSKVIDGEISELLSLYMDSEYKKNSAVVIAAGPSLNENIEFIKEKSGDAIVIAVDAALKKLITNDIVPDYVTVIDPNNPLMAYIEGIEEYTEKITLVAENVSYWKYVSKFKGPKYRVFCVDEPESVRYCKKNNIEVWASGRTVSNLAIELAVKLNVEIIYLVGLDLAYPGNKQHADGIGLGDEKKVLGDQEVRSVSGEKVPTTSNFLRFLADVENQIDRYPEVRFINKSKNGAWIKGCLMGKWWETEPDEVSLADYGQKLILDKELLWDEKYYLFRQLLARFQDTDNSLFETIIEKLYSDMLRNGIIIHNNIEKKKCSNGIVVLMVSNYSMADDKLFEDAVEIIDNGFQLIIINTNEFLGGTPIRLTNPVQIQQDNIDKDYLIYLGKRIPYFQFPFDMKFIDIINESVSFFIKNDVYRVISYDKYSLISKIAETIVEVRYR